MKSILGLSLWTQIKQMKNLFKTIWIFLDQLSGVVGSLILLSSLSVWLWRQTPKLPVYIDIVITSVILILTLVLLGKIRQFFQYLNLLNLEKQVTKDLKSRQPSLHFNIRDIPSTSKIKNWIKLAELRTKRWSEDAVLTSKAFFYTLDYAKGLPIRHRLGLQFYSNLKNEMMYVDIGSEEPLFSEAASNLKFNESDEKEFVNVPFYIKKPNWRDALIQVYKRFEDKIDDQFEISVTNSYADKIFIYFKYVSGSRRVHHNYMFEFDGEILSFGNQRIKI